MSNPSSLPKVTIKGPFWSAEADIITLADPKQNLAFRTLFVDTTPRAALQEERMVMPGTLLALSFVTSVTVSPHKNPRQNYVWRRSTGAKPEGQLSEQAIRSALNTGQLALLLLQADPDGWAARSGSARLELTCLAGDISLDVLQPQRGADTTCYKALQLTPLPAEVLATRSGQARLPGALSVHASGISIFGQTTFPWDQTPLAGVFQLARQFPDPPDPSSGERVPGFHLTIEADRLTSQEAPALLAAWQSFSRSIDPRNPINGLIEPPLTTTWATLAPTNPLALPQLHWQILPWREQPEQLPLHVAGDAFNLLFSDQQPYDLDHPPTALARIVLDEVSIVREGVELHVAWRSGTQPTDTVGQLTYDATLDDDRWTERLSLSHAPVAFNPTETPHMLREVQNLPAPVWVSGPDPAQTRTIDPPVVWGFMPLADGWAQLPIPNLTEQIYLDAQIYHDRKETDDPVAPIGIVQGAVAFGNDQQAVITAYREEQPWNLALINARSGRGMWTLTQVADGSYAVSQATATLFNPEAFINGLLWFSREPPTSANALPSLDNWIAGLASIPLRTITGGELFPPLIYLDLGTLNIELRDTDLPDANTTARPASATLRRWSFDYQADGETLKTLVSKRVLPAKCFSAHLPLVWRRHPTLPMIQALPLTQTLVPPNYPSPSRQFVPFELDTVPHPDDNAIAMPSQWLFGVGQDTDTETDVDVRGAATWPELRRSARPAIEWAGTPEAPVFDLPLVALSLPGLVLDPNPEGGATTADSPTGLPIQYRLDLPYTDELQALAQLPKVQRDPGEFAPLPDDPRLEPARPLTRAAFAAHWHRLAELASLASADAVAAFLNENGQTVIRYLIEPAAWRVRTLPDLSRYPGSLTIDNADLGQSAPLSMHTDAALRGIDGHFTQDGAGAIRRLTDGTVSTDVDYCIRAGTMEAHRDQNGVFYDQRGLARYATTIQTTLLRTRVQLTEETAYDLTSARQPCELRAGTNRWQFWFRDLPAHTGTFSRTKTRSRATQDANDPEALSREYNYLAGYEWRLRPYPSVPELPSGLLTLFNLHFYPLALETVVFADDGLQQVAIVGRLQLPLVNAGEQVDLSNVVRLTFTGSGTALNLSAVAAVSDVIEWPLALSGGEASDAPRLNWTAISLSNAGETLIIDGACLHFFLFGVEWQVSLPQVAISQVAEPIALTVTFPHATTTVPLSPADLNVTLDLSDYNHTVFLRLAVQLGNPGLQALYTFNEGNGTIVHDSANVDEPLDLRIEDPSAVAWGPDGLTVNAPTLIASAGPAARLIAGAQASNALTIEAWVRPSNLSQRGPMRIVTLSQDFTHRNFSLQQGAYDAEVSTFYHMRLRTTKTDENGDLPLKTPDGSMTDRLTHVVYTRSATGEACLYLDGIMHTQKTIDGDFANWDTGYRLALANELIGERAWRGTYRMVAIYDRALTPSEVAGRYAAGPQVTPIAQRRALVATVSFNLMAAHSGAAHWERGWLFEDLELRTQRDDSTPASIAGDTTLQFAWQEFVATDASQYQFLPGMALANTRTPGFAVLAFTAVSAPGGIPELRLKHAFVEALISCRWGYFIQRADGTSAALHPAQVFGSSAGDLTLGYTGRLQQGMWIETLLLNGLLEVKNLISWPQSLRYDNQQARLVLPPARPVATFPATRVIDDFNHADNSLRKSAALWVGTEGLGGYRIAQRQLNVDDGGPIYWQGAVFGVAQEAFVTLVKNDPEGREQCLLLKVQGSTPDWRTGAIKVRYNVKDREVRVETARPGQQNWSAYRDQRIKVTFQNGERFGARVLPDGEIWIYRNETLIGKVVLNDSDQSFFNNRGGCLGLLFKDAGSARIDNFGGGTAPATIPAPNEPPPRLIHLRHSMRVLLNQHELPGEMLRPVGGPLLFTFTPGSAWQFLAVVEHQVTRVDPAENLGGANQGDVRWTVVQEVRLLLPTTFQAFLDTYSQVRTVDPVQGVSRLDNASYGYFGAGLRALLCTPSVFGAEVPPNDMLLVEASAAHLVGLTPLLPPGATVLQYLPDGTQLALLSSPQDYAPSDPHLPQWLLLTMPFLGRLQDAARDGLDPSTGDAALRSLQVDPVLAITRLRMATPDQELPDLALALATWGDAAPVEVTVSLADAPVGRSLARLDPLALEESWFRVHNPWPEPPGALLQSVMASLPDTPSRLSRPIALRWAVDPRRATYPSAALESDLLPEPLPIQSIVWREASLLLTTGVSSLPTSNRPPYAWHLAAVQIFGISLIPPATDAALPRRHAAATLLPARLNVNDAANPRPLCLAISPYLGLEWRPIPQSVPSPLQLRLLLAEVLCLDPTTAQLRPVASHVWEVRMDKAEQTEAAIRTSSVNWAQQIQRHLAPDSPLAVLRFREINDNTNPDSSTEAPLTTTYGFALVPSITAMTALARHVFRIRSKLDQVRYREGQWSGGPIPRNIQDFEIAPPQTTGVQPIYLTQTPLPWALSALRVSLQYTAGASGTVGPARPDGDSGLTLWWQAPHYAVQYRSTLHTSRPTSGLPVRFRAPAIKSLLPVLSELPLPPIDQSQITDPPLPPAEGDLAVILAQLGHWQPVLPGVLRYLISGARPGVLFAIRNQLLRQSELVFGSGPEAPPPVGEGLVSGSVPAQHRMPRPAPLPDNDNGRPEVAVQPWASYFEPRHNSLVTTSPADEAFLAALTIEGGDQRETKQAQRLQMILHEPAHGAISPCGDTTLEFAIQPDNPPESGGWNIRLEIVDAGMVFPYDDPKPGSKPGRYTFVPRSQADLLRHLAGKPVGTSVLVRAHVRPHSSTDGFEQILIFPLRVIDDQALRLPLEPYFIHFEDPEYNRRLASASAHASGIVQLPGKAGSPVQRVITLSAERHTCNPDSTLAVRYDWGDDPGTADGVQVEVNLMLRRVDIDRIPRDLALDSRVDEVRSGTLVQLPLLAMKESSGRQAVFVPGDILQLVLQVAVAGSPVQAMPPLAITIVDAPVIPVPDAAYALLRAQEIAGRYEVECVRFAWGPDPSRVELVCPDDLRSEVVRRRAVFHFSDTIRSGTLQGYAVQKITPTGATHFPDLRSGETP